MKLEHSLTLARRCSSPHKNLKVKGAYALSSQFLCLWLYETLTSGLAARFQRCNINTIHSDHCC